MVDSLAKHLVTLLSGESLPATRVSARDRKKMQSLFETGVIEEVRAGAGRKIILRNRDALKSFIQKVYPAGLDGHGNGAMPPRSRSVANFKNAKKVRTTDAEILQLRGMNVDVLAANGKMLPLVEWCQLAGVAAIRLDSSSQWSCAGRIAIVENLEPFLHFENLKIQADLIYYSAGRLSDRVLKWFSSSGMAQCTLIHCGDYDPVGIDEYIRLQKACPGRVYLYLPENIEELFSRFGKSQLLVDSQAILARLRKESDPSVIRAVELMDRYNAGLEQEVLFVN
jgi:hypothetical protein